MLVLALAICYVLFFRSQPKLVEASTNAPGTVLTAPTDAPRSQHKASLDKAHDAAKQMKDERDEANSY